MAKKIVGFIKLQVPAGKANPSPPIGPALGQRGLNIMEFCKAFNAQTQGMEPGLRAAGGHHRVRRQVASPSSSRRRRRSVLIKKAIKLEKGSARPHTRQGRQDHARPARGDRQGQEQGPDRRRPRRRGPHHRRLRPLDGHHRGRASDMADQRLTKRQKAARGQGRQHQALSARRRRWRSSRSAPPPSSTSRSTSRCSSASTPRSPTRSCAAPS